MNLTKPLNPDLNEVNLIIDIGNTLVKTAVMDGGRIVAERSDERLHPSMLDDLFAAWPIRRAILASTRGEVDDIADMVRPRVEYMLEFTSQTPVPIHNAYHTPETLGRDRLAAAVGAAALYPGRNVLIVDFGTAVTIDLVTADNTFRGGCISPGVNTRFRALHDYTARLPLCSADEAETCRNETDVCRNETDVCQDETDACQSVGSRPLPELLGLTTEGAIRAGVMNGVAFEIEGYIARMSGEIDDLCVIFTGGDAKYFAKRIKNTIFANCNPVFCGLDRILEYNASEEHLD